MADELIFNKCIFETRISETVGNPYKDNPLGAAAAQLFALSDGFTTNNVDYGLLKLGSDTTALPVFGAVYIGSDRSDVSAFSTF